MHSIVDWLKDAAIIFFQKSHLYRVSFTCTDTANIDGLGNGWDDWRKKKKNGIKFYTHYISELPQVRGN